MKKTHRRTNQGQSLKVDRSITGNFFINSFI